MSDTHYSGDTPYGHVEFDHSNPNLTEEQFLSLAKIHAQQEPTFGSKLGEAFTAATQNPAIKPVINALTLPGRETEALGAGLGTAIAPAFNAFRSGERQPLASLQDIGGAISGQMKGTPSQAPGAQLGATAGSFADPVSLALSEFGGNALKPVLKRAMTRVLPTILEHEAGIPASATLQKLEHGTLPKVAPSASKEMYMNEVGKVIDRPTQDTLIDQLSSSGGKKPRSFKRSLELSDIDTSKIPQTSELAKMIASEGIETPILSKQDLSENAQKLRNLQKLVGNDTLRKSIGDRKLLTEVYNLRRNLDYSINWKPTHGSQEHAFKEANQNVLKTMRAQANRLIDQIPGGDVIRKADEGAKLRIAGNEFNKGFNRPSTYRLAGMGAAPFIVGRLANIAGMGPASYPLALAATLASQSPKAIGAMMDTAPKMLKPSIVSALQGFRKMLAGSRQEQQ